ncbi:hypothetical protein CMV_026824 [Castanea mollissima]|nr:hypothetical protein CMV_026824 [Castanea mollissima]
MYIEPDPSAQELTPGILTPGDHPSELFGFVNEVFQNFVKEWTAETLSRELDYVKLLASWKVLYNSVEAETPKLGKTPISSGNEQGKESNGIAGTSQDPSWLKSVYSEKAPQLDRAPVVFPRFTKLRLAEAQEMLKQKYEEVQALDRAH